MSRIDNSKEIVPLINGSGTTGHAYAKNEYRHRPFIVYKNWQKMHHRTKCKTRN